MASAIRTCHDPLCALWFRLPRPVGTPRPSEARASRPPLGTTPTVRTPERRHTPTSSYRPSGALTLCAHAQGRQVAKILARQRYPGVRNDTVQLPSARYPDKAALAVAFFARVRFPFCSSSFCALRTALPVLPIASPVQALQTRQTSEIVCPYPRATPTGRLAMHQGHKGAVRRTSHSAHFGPMTANSASPVFRCGTIY